MFLGEYQVKFSGQSRIVLPKTIRDELGENRVVILSRGFEGCIWGFSQKGFAEEAQKQLGVSATEERARFLRRYLFASSVPAVLDTQGRFVIPAALLDYAKVKSDLAKVRIEVTIIGAGDHFEVWNADLWKKHLKEVEGLYRDGRVS